MVFGTPLLVSANISFPEDDTLYAAELDSSAWPRVTEVDDDDKWMFVEPQFIDQLLAEHAFPNMDANAATAPLNPEAEKTLDDLAKTVKQFVHEISIYFAPSPPLSFPHRSSHTLSSPLILATNQILRELISTTTTIPILTSVTTRATARMMT